MDSVGQDLRYTLRIVRRAPLFYAGAILTLALGIGANGAVFSILQAVLLQPLPYDHPSEVVMVWRAPALPPTGPNAALQGVNRHRGLLTSEMVMDWREQSKDVLGDFAAIKSWSGNLDAQFDLVLGERAERLRAAFVTPNFFDLLGVSAARGRLFTPADGPKGDALLVLSDALWHSAFGGDSTIVGRAITLIASRPRVAHTFTVVGILPPAFRFTYPRETEAWALRSWAEFAREPHGAICCEAVARLKSGIRFEAAAARMAGMRSDLDRPNMSPQDRQIVRLERIYDWVVGETRPSLQLLGAVALLLLGITCANVANAFFVRITERQQELAVRASLGAGRRRLVRQLLTEGVVLSLAGAVAGTLAATVLVPVLRALVPPIVPRSDEIGVNEWMLAFGIVAAAVTTIVSALVPAWRGGGVDLVSTLKRGAGATSADRLATRWRQALVGLQVAVATALLISAALLLTSFWRLGHVPLGFDGEGVLTAEMRLLDQRYWPKRLADKTVVQSAALMAFQQDLVSRVRGLPGVLDAGITSAVPFRGVDFIYVTHAVGQQKRVVGNARFVDPAYFSVMQIPLTRGRLFSGRDTVTSGNVTVLSESYARQMFGFDNALGKQIDNDGPVEVVGLVRDARYVALDKEPAPAIYFPAAQFPSELVCLVARTLPNAGDLGPAVRRIVHDLDPALPAMNVTTIDRIINESVGQRRFYTTATSAFAALALLLTIVGLVVVVARSVVERRRELAIRAALGATAPRLVRSVVGQGLVPVLMGTAAGLGSAYVGATLLAQFLFQVTPREPMIYAAAAVVIVAVAALASFVPARRVTSVAPADVMRAE